MVSDDKKRGFFGRLFGISKKRNSFDKADPRKANDFLKSKGIKIRSSSLKLLSALSNEEKRSLLDLSKEILSALLIKKKSGDKLMLHHSASGSNVDMEKLSVEELKYLVRIQELTSDADKHQPSDFHGRINKYNKVLEIAPWDSISVMSIGVQYYKMGKRSDSIEWLKYAFEIDPQNRRIRDNLEAVLG